MQCKAIFSSIVMATCQLTSVFRISLMTIGYFVFLLFKVKKSLFIFEFCL